MTPERWQKVRDVLEQALELAPEKRSRFLDVACSSDPTLRNEVQSLLSADAQARSSFLETPPLLPAALTPGTRLGDYEIVSQIGSGGMGVVYRARDTRLGRDVAIKVLPTHLSADTSRLRRFEQEAQSAALLNHPNILAIYQLGSYEGAPYLVSELLEGETLREELRQGPLSQERVLDYAQQIAGGLSAAHERGIIHRDLKPENLFVTKDHRIKILDFGLAKLAERDGDSAETVATLGLQTLPGQVAGTVGYMSPEQVRGEKLDTRTDLFSFGVVLYEMATGKRPFRGDTSALVFNAILERAPVAPVRLNPDVPAELELIINKALEKDRNLRFQSAAEMRADLQRLKRDTQSGKSAVTMTAAPVSRKRSLWLGVGVTLVVLAAITCGAYRYLLPRAVPFQQIEITQLTTTGKVTNAAISPDGRYVAYAVDELGESFYLGGKTKQSLWVRQVAGGDVQVSPSEEVGYAGLTFSPNGDFLYAARSEDKGSINSLYKVPVLGGTAQRLIADMNSKVTLSPDGKQIAFVRISGVKSESALVVANETGSGERELVVRKWSNVLGNVAWSPNGSVIAAVAGDSESGSIQWHPIVVSVQDNSEHPTTSSRWTNIADLAWVSDGRGLVMNAQINGLYQLEYISYASGETRRITNDLNDYLGVSLTEDSHILATVQVKRSFDTWVAPITDVNSAKPITSGGRSSEAKWSPNGKIVYDQRGGRGERNIWVMESDGNNARQLTVNTGVDNLAPRACGGRIVFISLSGGSPHLWRMDIDGNNTKQLTNSPRDLLQVGSADCTPDGKWVVYGKWGPDWGIWKVPIEGGDPVRLNKTTYAAFPAISPDGKMLAYSYVDESGRNGVAVMSLEGSTLEKRFDIATECIRWTLDSQSLLYTNTEGRISNIWSQPISGEPPKQITHFNSELIASFDLSRDGKQLVMNRGTTNRDVVLIRDVK